MPAIAATGQGDVVAAVLSLSSRSADGEDAAYLRWHVLDHLPEQYRLVGLRHAQRWVSTPACRAARAAEAAPYDSVDHAVCYLFGPPLGRALDDFFDLGRALYEAGRMPLALPRVDVAVYERLGARAAARVLVGADVLPWCWSAGIYLIIERMSHPTDGHPHSGELEGLADVPGVAGVWRFRGTDRYRPDRLASHADLRLTVCYLDGAPVAVAGRLADRLQRRWERRSSDGLEPLLAAPFEIVVPPDWHRHLPS